MYGIEYDQNEEDLELFEEDLKTSKTVHIKEFDLNSMPPLSEKDKNGVKLVVIGKPGCFAKGTKVLMYDGSMKNVEDVIVGDLLMGDDNTSRTVKCLYSDVERMYKIIPKYGEPYTVNERHDLALYSVGRFSPKGTIVRISVRDYFKMSNQWKKSHKLFKSSGIYCWEDKQNIIDETTFGSEVFQYNHIPESYKINSYEKRDLFLKSLLKTYGTKMKNKYHILSHHKRIIDDIVFLARSLGYLSTSKKINNIYVVYIFLTKSFNQFRFTIQPLEEEQYYGFSVDKNHRFLLGSFDVVYNTGKSTIIQDIIASKAHMIPVAQVFSGTEDSNHFYSEKFPSICVYNKLDEKAVEQFVKRQKIAKQHLPNPWAIQIIDDCTDDPKILSRPLFQSYYKNGRHWNMIHILSLQYCLDIKPNIRTNIDYTFILRETNLKNRRSLHENYAGCVDNFQDFCDIMDQITEDYTALVINNRVQSNKIEDCIFWYKANPNSIPPNWKFGHPSAWEFHHQRFDDNFSDPVIT